MLIPLIVAMAIDETGPIRGDYVIRHLVRSFRSPLKREPHEELSCRQDVA